MEGSTVKTTRKMLKSRSYSQSKKTLKMNFFLNLIIWKEEKDDVISEEEDNIDTDNQFDSQELVKDQIDVNVDCESVIKIRKGYSKLLEKIQNEKREITTLESDKLSFLIDEANMHFAKVATTSDATLDSRFIAVSAELGAEKVIKLPQGTNQFSLDWFLNLMNTFFFKYNDVQTQLETFNKLVKLNWKGIESMDSM